MDKGDLESVFWFSSNAGQKTHGVRDLPDASRAVPIRFCMVLFERLAKCTISAISLSSNSMRCATCLIPFSLPFFDAFFSCAHFIGTLSSKLFFSGLHIVLNLFIL